MTRQERYKPFGETLWSAGTNTPTTQAYTGQKRESSFGLYDYNARWYDAALGRFTQADSIVPNPAGAKSFDRYAYVENNPVRYSDPSGHFINLGFAAGGVLIGGAVGAISSTVPQMVRNIQQGNPLLAKIDPGEVAKNAAIGATVGAIGGLTFGVGLAAGAAIAGAAGVTAGSGSAAALGVATVAAAGAASGQTSRITSNALHQRDLLEDVGRPEDMAIDALLSVGLFALGGGSFSNFMNTSVKSPGNVDPKTLMPNPEDTYITRGASDTKLEYHFQYVLRNGQIENPIGVIKTPAGELQIYDGHHRWWAATRLGLKNVPIEIDGNGWLSWQNYATQPWGWSIHGN
jgi:RHS repeat-associated protein